MQLMLADNKYYNKFPERRKPDKTIFVRIVFTLPIYCRFENKRSKYSIDYAANSE